MIKYEDYKEIFKTKKEFDLLVNKISKLNSSNNDLIVSDFDDTIFSRDEQKNKSELFKKYSNISSTEVVLKYYWLDNFINTYFKNTIFPTEITSKLREKQDLILTAWKKELQEAKLKSTKLNRFNYIIVDNPIDKIYELIKYIALELKYIPIKVTIYEDKIKYFVEYKILIEKLLNTKLDIIEVEMNWNNWYKKLSKK